MAAWDPKQIYRLGETAVLNTVTYTCARDYNYNNPPSATSTWWSAPAAPTAAGWEYIASATFAIPAVPASGATTTAVATLANVSALEPGATYMIVGAAWIAAFDNTPVAQPHRIVWEAGTDQLQISVACGTSDPSLTVDVSTMSCLYNARGFVGDAYDYPFQLLVTLDGNPLTGNLSIEALVKNVSGTISYGTESKVDAIVYKAISP